MYEQPYCFTSTDKLGQAFTTEATSTYSFDLGATGKYIGNAGKNIVFRAIVRTAFETLTSGVRIQICTSDSADGSSDRAVGQLYTSATDDDGVIPVTDLATAGDQAFGVIAPNIPLLRYIHIAFVPVSEAASAGKLDVYMEDGAGEAGTGCVA